MVALVLMLTACSDGETGEATAGQAVDEATTRAAAKTAPTTVAPATTAPATSVPSELSQGANAVDPWGHGEIKDPTTQEEVNVIFLAMPVEIDGMVATRDDPEHVGFVDYEGNGSHASIAWFDAGWDAAAAIKFLTWIQDSDKTANVSGDLDSSDNFVWMEAETTTPDGQLFMAWWGDPTDGWLFNAAADTPDHRDAVIDAFIASAST
jgi:hypothetical protein